MVEMCIWLRQRSDMHRHHRGLHSLHSLTRVKPKENVLKGFAKRSLLLLSGENGRKGKSYEIMLHFPPECFFHLSGLQHLTDITFPSKNKERIYKEILTWIFYTCFWFVKRTIRNSRTNAKDAHFLHVTNTIIRKEQLKQQPC